MSDKARRDRKHGRNSRICTIVQVEQEAGHVLVVDSASSVCFILGNKLNIRERRNK